MLKKQITFAECQRQRTESRRSAKAKHLKNVRDKKSARDGRKLAKNEVHMTECQEIMVRDLRDEQISFHAQNLTAINPNEWMKNGAE